MRTANQVKTRYLRASSVHSTFLAQISDNPAYSWANNDKQLTRLTSTWGSITDHMDPFAKFYVMNDIAEVNKQWPDELEQKLSRFSTELADELGKLEREHTRINIMHTANLVDA